MDQFTDAMRKPVGLTTLINLDGDAYVDGIYGKEVIIDLYECDTSKFNRKDLRKFFVRLVRLLKMKRGSLHFWDDVGVPAKERQTKIETTGTSAVQFILTSNITVHCLDKLERVYINIFSCKDFEAGDAKEFVREWFGAGRCGMKVVYRP